MRWDPAAAAHVDEVAQALRDCGALEAFSSQLRAVWRDNLDRYEPGALGDTVRLLGQMCAENLASRMMRDRHAWQVRGIEVDYPSNSLLLTFQGRRLHVVKVPQADSLHPDWTAFHWASASNVRFQAAEANSRVFATPHLEPDVDPLFPAQQAGYEPADVDAVDEFFLVWAGDLRSDALTAGWLGAPSTGPRPWLAVTPLWHDFTENASHTKEPVATQEHDDGVQEPDVPIRLRPAAVRRPS